MVRVAATATVLISLLAGASAAVAAETSPAPPFSTARDDTSVMLWLRRNTSLRLGASVVFSDDNVLVVMTDEPDPNRPSLHRVAFRQEATRIDFVSRTGGRSIRGGAEVDCGTGRVKASSIVLYSGSDLRGDQILSQGPDRDWRAPVAGTASALVVAEVCAPPKRPAVAANTLPPPRPAAPVAIPMLPAAPPSRPQAPPAPVAPAAPPRPAPAPAPPAPPAPTPARDAGMTLAQIGAFSSRALAEAAWAHLSSAFPAYLNGKTVRIEPAMVNGAQVFRTSIQGFESEASARATCSELMARSQACFVRKTP